MPLNVHTDKIKNYGCHADGTPFADGSAERDNLNLLEYVMAQMTMLAGMPEITASNAGEFYRRVHLIEKVNDAWRIAPDGKPRYISYEEVLSFVGFRTNVQSKTKAQFNKSILDGHNWNVNGIIMAHNRKLIEAEPA